MRGAAPLWTAPGPPQVPAVAAALAHEVEGSGLFYESHLREFAGLSYEVAQVLDASVPAIKTRIHRARLTIVQQTSSWQ